MKKLFSLILALAMISCSTVAFAAPAPTPDRANASDETSRTPTSDGDTGPSVLTPATPSYLIEAFEAGIVHGRDGTLGSFDGEAPATKAEVLRMLFNAFGPKNIEEIDPAKWWGPAYSWFAQLDTDAGLKEWLLYEAGNTDEVATFEWVSAAIFAVAIANGHGEIEANRSPIVLAQEWAADRGFPIWRYDKPSPDGQSDTKISRLEAVELVVGLHYFTVPGEVVAPMPEAYREASLRYEPMAAPPEAPAVLAWPDRDQA